MSNYRVQPIDADKRLVYDDDDTIIGKVVGELESALDMYDTSVLVTKLSDFNKASAQHGQTVFIVTMYTEELFSDVETMLLEESDRHAAFVGCTDDEREMETFRKFKSKLEKKKTIQTSQSAPTKNSSSAHTRNEHSVHTGIHLSSVKDFENYSKWLPDMLRFLFSDTRKRSPEKEIGVLFPIKNDSDEPIRWSQEITKVLENTFQIKCALREPRNIDTDNDILLASSHLVCMHLDNGTTVRVGKQIQTSLSEEEEAVIRRAIQEGCSLLLYVTRGNVSFLGELQARYGLDVAGNGQVSYLIEVLRLLAMVKLDRRRDTTVYTSGDGGNFRAQYGDGLQRPLTTRTTRKGIVRDANIREVWAGEAQPGTSNQPNLLASLKSKTSFYDVCLTLQGSTVNSSTPTASVVTNSSCTICVLL